MMKKMSLFFTGYLMMIFIIYIISTWDPYSPAIFGKWALVLTPLYIICALLVNYLIKKYDKAK